MNVDIAIFEDQVRVRENLRKRLSFYDDIEIMFEAPNAKVGIEKLRSISSGNLPQVILMDIEMPGMTGIEATALVKEEFPNIDILIQTVFEDDERIFQSIQAGASGYLLKDDPIQKYVDAIKELDEGGAALSSTIALKVMNFVQQAKMSQTRKAEEAKESFSLTTRELDILQAIVDDLSDDQIGERLFISPHTVRTHIKNMYKKLHVHSRASAVKFAFTKGLIRS
jgi:DNA-binding NarL/FixJ family response regulator